jgi:hypothetical protein
MPVFLIFWFFLFALCELIDLLLAQYRLINNRRRLATKLQPNNFSLLSSSTRYTTFWCNHKYKQSLTHLSTIKAKISPCQ